MGKRLTLKNAFSSPNSPKATGKAGYDNPRENIDPHVRTQAMSSKEITLSDGLGAGFVKSDANGVLSGGHAGGGVGGADTQIQFNDGGVLAGDADLTWTKGTEVLQLGASSAATRLLLPLSNDSATPTLAFGDGDTGFYESADDNLSVGIGGNSRWYFTSNIAGSSSGQGPAFIRVSATNTIPSVTPNQSDSDTGIGWTAADALSLISGGKEMLRLVETGTATSDQLIIAPAGIIGTAATPALAFGDGDSGFYEVGDDDFMISIGGTASWRIDSGKISAFAVSGAAQIQRETASATNPIFVANGDVDSGLGFHSADNPCIVAGGLEAARFEDPADLAAGETSLWLYDDDNGTIEQVTVGAADSGGAGYKVLRIPN